MSAPTVDEPRDDHDTPLEPLEEIYYQLGRALAARKQYEKAIDAFENALQEDSAKAYAIKARREMAKAFQLNGNTHRALRVLLEAVIVKPEEAEDILPETHQLLRRESAASEWDLLKEAWKDRVNLRALHQDDQPAAKLLEHKVSDRNRASIALLLGRMSLYGKDYSVAAKFFKEAKQLAPDDARVFEGLGETLWKGSREETNVDKRQALAREAQKALKQAHDLVKSGHNLDRKAAIQAKRARVLVASGKFKRALDVIEEERDSPDSYTYEMSLTRSQSYLGLGKANDALEAAVIAADRDPTAAVPHVLQARALTALGDYDNALIETNRALQIDPSNLEALLCQAQALIEGQFDLDRASRLIKHYVTQSGPEEVKANLSLPEFTVLRDDGNFHFFLAHLRRALGQPKEAEREVTRALELELKPDSSRVYPEAPALHLKAELLEEAGQKDTAFDLFYEAGRGFVRRQQYSKAATIFEHAVGLKPKDQSIYWYWADALRNLSYKAEYPFVDGATLDGALQQWETGYSFGPPSRENAWAYVVRALTLEAKSLLHANKAKALWEAVVSLEKHLIVDSSNAYAWAYMARCYRNLFLDANALHASKLALRLTETEPLVLLERATTLSAVGDETTIEFIEEHSDAFGDYRPWINAVKASALCQAEHYQQASKLLDTTADVSSTDPWYRSLRGRALLLAGKADKAKLEFDWIWTATTPGSVLGDHNNLGTRARSAYELGRWQEACAILELVVDNSDIDPFDSRILPAFCYLALNDWDKAEDRFREALTLLRNARQVSESLQDLTQLQSRLKNKRASGIIRKYKEKVATKRASVQGSLQSETDCILELQRIIVRKGTESDSFLWQAIQAGLARLYTDINRSTEAVGIYEILQKKPYQFPEPSYNDSQTNHKKPD